MEDANRTQGETMSKGKIAVITQAVKLADEAAGLNRSAFIAQLLAEEGYEVDLLTSTFQHWEKAHRNIVDPKYHELPYDVIFIEEPGYRANISPSRIYSQCVFASNLQRYLEHFGEEYDLIWCKMPPNNVAATAGEYAKQHDIPFVVDINDLWPEAMKMIANVPIVSDFVLADFVRESAIAFANASAAVGTSNEYANHCLQDIPHLTVYVGSDIAYFDEGVRKHGSLVQKSPDEIWIAYAGSLARSYDISTLIEACELASSQIEETTGKTLHLFILGDGTTRERLESLGSKCSFPITFTGYVDYQIMAAYLSKSDMLVNSLSKNAPQSIVSKISDYLCAGKPIINTGESTEFKTKCVDDGFGVNVEPENELEIAGAITLLAQNEELCEEMGRRGRAIAEAQFDRRTSYKRIVDLINDLLSK